ncbi:MAG: AMP-binding protein, partial [bacterium]|nr:AMP-binding protein [bacterium]
FIYVIYTSGSTGRPKGVPIKTRGFVNLVHWYNVEFGINSGDKFLLIAPVGFDLAQKNLFAPLMVGGTLCLPLPGLPDYGPLSRFISSEGQTVINCAPSVFYPLLERNREDGYLKLKTLRYVFLGGEPIQGNKLNEWLNSGSCSSRVVNTYGPTECTDVVSSYTAHNKDFEEMDNIPIGKPANNVLLYIMDKNGKLQPVGLNGELCIGGDGLAEGYLNNPELTAQRFIYYPVPLNTYLYHTGDLCRWRADGNIEFLGRIDQQIKIRGFRVEPGEIEKQLGTHPKIKEAVVIAKERDSAGRSGEKFLCAYYIKARSEELQVSQLREYMTGKLPSHMIPSVFLEIEEVPLTPSGKLDRKALPDPGTLTEDAYCAPGNEIEVKLADIWQDELGLQSVGVDDNFFDSGGHSLKAIGLVNAIRKEFDIEIAVSDIFLYPTIKGLSGIIAGSKTSILKKIGKQPEKEYYELSYSQERLWFLYQKDPDAPTFNMPGKLTLYEAVNENLVENILNRLIDRHESFRTCFKEIDKKVRQVVLPEIIFKLEIEVLSKSDEAEIEKQREAIYHRESTKPFDLGKAPLLRVKLVKYREQEFDLIFNLHHIIADGWSMDIVKREFAGLYDAVLKGEQYQLPPLEIQYKDYSHWQNDQLKDEESSANALEYWKNCLDGQLPLLKLPYDYPGKTRSGEDSLENEKTAAYRFVLPLEVLSKLKAVAKKNNGSLFSVLLAAFNILLSHITGQSDFIIAIPAATRQHEKLKNIIGMFVNTLILRNNVKNGDTFLQLFKRVRDFAFKALEFQYYPMELVCSRLKIKYPEISAFFNMLNTGDTHLLELDDLETHHIEKVQSAKFKFVCYLTHYKNGIEIQCHYFSSLFNPSTIEKIMRIYSEILKKIAYDPTDNVSEYTRAKKKRKFKRAGPGKKESPFEITGQHEEEHKKRKFKLAGPGKKESPFEITRQHEEEHKKLSTVNGDWLRYAKNNPELLDAANYKILETHKSYHTLNPWPTFINRRTKEWFREASEGIFSLTKQLPQRVFDNDPGKISDYYVIPESLARLQLEGISARYLDSLLARGDFIYSPSGLKCLEFNVSSNLGGWQIPLYENLYLNIPVISRFLKDHDVIVKNENLLSLFLRHLLSCLPDNPGSDCELNIALIKEGFRGVEHDPTGIILSQLYKDILKDRKEKWKGDVFMCEFKDLSYGDKRVYYRERPIHIMVEMYNGVVPPLVMEAFKSGNICLINGPITALLSNKLNLALLSDYERTGIFTPGEKKFIDNYIPWTRKIIPGETTFAEGKVPELITFILSHREKMVIKPGMGYGGTDVIIGKNMSPLQWEYAVREAARQGNWVVQEWIEPVPLIYQAGEYGCEPHDTILGLFVLGPRFSGTYVRVMSRKNSKNVINVHLGARVS